MTHPEDCAEVLNDQRERIQRLREALEIYTCNKKHKGGFCAGERASKALRDDDAAALATM